MSDSQRLGKKSKASKTQEKPATPKVSTVDAFDIPEVATVVEEKPKAATQVQTKTVQGTGISVDAQKILRWAARLRMGGYGIYMNGANFGNHMIKDCFKVDGKEITVEEAARLINPHTSV